MKRQEISVLLLKSEVHPQNSPGEQLVTLVEIIEENNDATLKELTELLESKTGIKVSISTMGRISNQLNYTFTKKHSMRQRKEASEFKKPE